MEKSSAQKRRRAHHLLVARIGKHADVRVLRRLKHLHVTAEMEGGFAA